MTSGGGFITDGDAPTAQLKVTLADQVKTGEEKKNNLHPGKGLNYLSTQRSPSCFILSYC